MQPLCSAILRLAMKCMATQPPKSKIEAKLFILPTIRQTGTRLMEAIQMNDQGPETGGGAVF
ncbi:MAG: hypothetical protein JNN17_02740 [Verrucomicrobiaceae bacterium]|nr:hypothetical protein [Verrucomicrobiaceae bacterium]